MKLNVIFQTQTGNETRTSGRNDCGAACVGMVASRTVGQVLADISQPGNQPLHVYDVQSALRRYYIANEHVRPLTLDKLRELLSQRQPVIALARYGRLPSRLKADPNFDDNHFVVVVGYSDGSFFVHDPLWATAERGAYAEWPNSVMDEALRYVKALPHQGVVVRRSFELAAENDLPETAAHYLEMLYEALGIPPGQPDERQGHALARIAQLGVQSATKVETAVNSANFFSMALGAIEQAKAAGKLCYVLHSGDGITFATSLEWQPGWLFRAYPGGRKELSVAGKDVVGAAWILPGGKKND